MRGLLAELASLRSELGQARERNGVLEGSGLARRLDDLSGERDRLIELTESMAERAFDGAVAWAVSDLAADPAEHDFRSLRERIAEAMCGDSTETAARALNTEAG
jgi:hypothetical protein